MTDDLTQLVAGAMRSAEMDRPRTQQLQPGISSIGGCRRRVSYGHHQVPWTDEPGYSGAAQLGTWLHSQLLPLLRKALPGRVLVEKPVHLDWQAEDGRLFSVPGTLDLYAWRMRTLLDLKTADDYRLASYRVDGVPRKHSWQLHLYAEALAAAGIPRPQRMAIVYLGRTRGQLEVIDVPWQEGTLLEALAWYEEATAQPPSQTPRDERGPGLSWVCDACPWRSSCWEGYDPPQQALVAEGQVSVGEALSGLWQAGQAEAQGKKDKAFYRAILDGQPTGLYGQWELKRTRDTPPKLVLDAPAAEQALRQLGVQPPMKVDNGRKGYISAVPTEAVVEA